MDNTLTHKTYKEYIDLRNDGKIVMYKRNDHNKKQNGMWGSKFLIQMDMLLNLLKQWISMKVKDLVKIYIMN